MPITFTISAIMLRAILTELRRQPYHIAVGPLGLNRLPDGRVEWLARSFRCIHEGALGGLPADGAPRFELGFVPFSLNRPQAWQAAALAARVAGDRPAALTCSIMLGSGGEVGLFTGICSAEGQIAPVQSLKIVGAGIRQLAAVDFRALRQQALSPEDADRWSRLIGALGGPEVWQSLTSLRYCIIGAGRTGSLVATTLTKEGVHHLCLMDPDVLERHNLDAMDAVSERDIGRFKAEVVAESLRRERPGLQIRVLAQSVMGVEARACIKDADVLVCCVDDEAARLAVGALACCYLKPLLDIGTGVFDSRWPAAGEPRRVLGADVRLIVPGDGCLRCWGGLTGAPEAWARWRRGEARRRWDEERSGSLRSLNEIAAHLGLRLLEDWTAGRRAQSGWVQFEMDAQGTPALHAEPAQRLPACPLCATMGLGDRLTEPQGEG